MCKAEEKRVSKKRRGRCKCKKRGIIKLEIKNKKTEAWRVWSGLFVIYIGINLVRLILSISLKKSEREWITREERKDKEK